MFFHHGTRERLREVEGDELESDDTGSQNWRKKAGQTLGLCPTGSGAGPPPIPGWILWAVRRSKKHVHFVKDITEKRSDVCHVLGCLGLKSF
jgi:hypothetical protein